MYVIYVSLLNADSVHLFNLYNYDDVLHIDIFEANIQKCGGLKDMYLKI